MNAAAASGLLALLALAAPSAPSALRAAEPVQLAWELAEGERFLVVSENATETTTVTAAQEQHQSITNSTTRRVTVEEVDDAGAMHLAVTVEAVTMTQDSDAMKLELVAERDEDGDERVSVSIESPDPTLTDGEMERFFESFGEALLGITFEMTIDAAGHVIASSLDGDPFAGLSADSEVTEMALMSLEMMISSEDLLSVAAAELFVQLAPEPVEVGSSWGVSRGLAVAGLALLGKGETTLDGVQGGVATLTESMDWEVDADGLAGKMVDLMRLVFERVGMDLEASIDLDGEDFASEGTLEFDVAGGHLRSASWSEQTIELAGSMEIGPQQLDMDIETVVTRSASRWERIEDEGGDER